MCGLIAVFSNRDKAVGQQVFDLYTKQKNRGKDGFGFLALDKDYKLLGIHRSLTEYDIKRLLMKEKAPNILFHHRFPTSTKNTLGTTHPMFISHKELDHDYYFSHNGVILNSDSLKTKHEKLGYVYKTEFVERTINEYSDGSVEEIDLEKAVYNDSETLCIEIARYVDGKSKEIKTTGAVAFWGIKLKKGTNKVLDVYYGRNLGRDLCVMNRKKYTAITSITGTRIEPMKLFTMNLKEEELYEEDLPIDKSYKPVLKTVRVKSNYDSRRESTVVPTQAFAEMNLRNAFYTREEAIDSGVPLSEFIVSVNNDIKTFVPSKYAGKYEGREAFDINTKHLNLPEPYKIVEPPETSKKTLETLEGYCEKYARIQTQIDNNDSDYENKLVSREEHGREDVSLDLQLQGLMDKISALDSTPEENEDMLSLCEEMEGYNNAYSINNEGIIE